MHKIIAILTMAFSLSVFAADNKADVAKADAAKAVVAKTKKRHEHSPSKSVPAKDEKAAAPATKPAASK